MAKFDAVGLSVGVVTVITTFFLFAIGGILYFYWGDASAVKDALSTAASFFGGFATLGAAYIATKLVVNWRDQTKYNEQLRILAEMINEAIQIHKNIEHIRSDQNLAEYLLGAYVLIDTTDTISESDEGIAMKINNLSEQNPMPDSSILQNNIHQIQNLYFQLKLYSRKNNTQNEKIFQVLSDLDETLKVFRTNISLLYIPSNFIEKIRNQESIDSWIVNAMFASVYFSKVLSLEKRIAEPTEAIENLEILKKRIYNLISNIYEYQDALDGESK